MQVQELVSARVPAATFYGHPRPKYIPAPARNRARAGARVSHAATHDARRWTPEPLEEPERPPKGAFTVSVNGRVVASTGPEVSTPSPPSPPSPPAAPGCCLPACAEAGAGRRASGATLGAFTAGASAAAGAAGASLLAAFCVAGAASFAAAGFAAAGFSGAACAVD